MNLILLFEKDFIDKDTVSLTDRRFEHMTKILKVEQGTKVKVGLVDALIGTGEVIDIDKDSVKLSVKLTDKAPAALNLTLICALPRPQTLKKVLQAVVAFGVKKIYFINTKKVEKSYWSSPLLTEEKLREHIIMGLEQSCDTVMPEIFFRKGFKNFVEDELLEIVGDSTGMTAHPEAKKACPSQLGGAITLCVGPEGGFNDYEIEMLAQHACPAVYLGMRPLRTEFAVCALLGRLS